MVKIISILVQHMINDDQIKILLYCCDNIKSHRLEVDTVPLNITCKKTATIRYNCCTNSNVRCLHSPKTPQTWCKLSSYKIQQWTDYLIDKNF